MEQVKLPKGIPLRVPATAAEVAALADDGPSVSFLLGENDKGAAKVYKVVRNLIGTAVVEAGPIDLGLVEVKEMAWFTLPPIPEAIVRKLDVFFRAVDRKHGAESIVLLTFDPDLVGTDNAAEGWGVVVPRQQNNSTHCNYDHASVVDDKDEHLMIVGSVHSHPGMSAFASHTDHGDQADFDGIHITYGWSKNSSHTEYHIELQMSGTHFTLKPEQAFALAAEPEEFPELDDWLAKVEKKVYTPAKKTGGGNGNGGYSGYGSYGSYGSYGDEHWENSNWNSGTDKKLTLPATVPDPHRNTVLIDIRTGESICPACKTFLAETNRARRRCDGCCSYVLMPGETPEKVREVRVAAGLPVGELDEESWWWKRSVSLSLESAVVEELGKAEGLTGTQA